MSYKDMCLYKHIEQKIEDLDLIFVLEAPVCDLDALICLRSFHVQYCHDHQFDEVEACPVSSVKEHEEHVSDDNEMLFIGFYLP